MIHGPSNVKFIHTRYTCYILMKLEFSRHIFGKKKMKFRPVEAELFHADGRTDGQKDMTKLTVAFRNLANAPKMVHNP